MEGEQVQVPIAYVGISGKIQVHKWNGDIHLCMDFWRG